MTRSWLAASTMILVLVNGAPARAAIDDAEPEVQGRKLSEWEAILKTDKDEKRRRASLIAFKIIAMKLETAKVVPPVVTAAKEDASDSVRKAATQALGNMALGALEYLDPRRANTEKKKTEICKQTLKMTTDGLLDPLRDEKSAEVRQAAAESIGRLGKDGAFATEFLTAALKDKADPVRAAAAEALGRIGPDAKPATSALVETLRDKKADRTLRLFAAFALGRIAPNPPNLPVAALSEALRDTETPVEVRKAAAESLGLLGTSAEDAVPALGEVLKDAKGVEIRRAAGIALGQIGPSALKALPELRYAAANDQDRFVRSHVAHTIGGLGKDAADAIPELVVLAKGDPVTDVRVAAIESLGQLGVKDAAAIDVLSTASRSSQTVLREAALAALKKLQDN